jgi:hypothetical protein
MGAGLYVAIELSAVGLIFCVLGVLAFLDSDPALKVRRTVERPTRPRGVMSAAGRGAGGRNVR